MPTRIDITSDDVEALSRLAAAEARTIYDHYRGQGVDEQEAARRAYGSVVDSILNRAAADSDNYGGNEVQDVINKSTTRDDGRVIYQYTPLEGKGTWEKLDEAPDVRDYVEGHLAARANGEVSSVGPATHYYNPESSNPSWGGLMQNSLAVGTPGIRHVFGWIPTHDPVAGDYVISYDGQEHEFVALPKPPPGLFFGGAGILFGFPGSLYEADLGPFSDFWNRSSEQGSPLVLDLDNDGIDAVALNSPQSVYWDIDQDGFGEATGWISGDDGFLAIDRNLNGVIDNNNELFGTTGTDGFDVLRAIDTDLDGAITSSDALFDRLRVWCDINSNGYSEDDEIFQLADLGITEISLASQSVNYDVSGNWVTAESSFIRNGLSYNVADVWFDYDPTNTAYRVSEPVDIEVLHLPELRGYGHIKNLSLAMSSDADLRDAVETFAEKDSVTLFNSSYGLSDVVTDIMYRWAAVEGVEIESRGVEIGDARIVAFLETFTGTPFLQLGVSPNPAPEASYVLREAFSAALRHITARLLFQTDAATIFDDVGIYNPVADKFEGTFTLDFDAIEQIIDGTGLTGANLQTTWVNILSFIDQVMGLDELDSGDETALIDLIDDTTGSALDYADLKLFAEGYVYGLSYAAGYESRTDGTSGGDTLNGGTYRDILNGLGGNDTLNGADGRDQLNGGDGTDALNGGGGNDTLDGGAGDDTLAGDAGDDYLLGDAGNDIYQYFSGWDIIREVSGTDTIKLPAGFSLADMLLSYSGINGANLDIFFDGIRIITIENVTGGSGSLVETMDFATEPDFMLAAALGAVITTPTSGNTWEGIDNTWLPDDRIEAGSGADTLIGGLGNDYLWGDGGNDTYIVGSGVDTIYEQASDTGDNVRFGAGVDEGDLSFEVDQNGTDLLIYQEGVLKVRVADQFSSANVIEYISLNGVSTITLATVVPTHNGTSGADFLQGITQGASSANIINGLGGNDIIWGYAGADTINGGDGDDTLNGGDDSDTYVYTLSDFAGLDTITETGGSDDKICVHTDLASSGLSFSRNGDYNLIVNLEGRAAFLIAGFFQNSLQEIESIYFTDNQSVSLASLENYVGGSGNDTHDGDTSSLLDDDVMFGMGGNDTLNGLDGADVLYGGAGNDTLNGGDGNDTLRGENDADTLNGGAGNDLLEGGAGNDIYLVSAGTDRITDSAGTDILQFGSGVVLGDVALIRDYAADASGNSLRIEADDDTVLVARQFDETGYGIETLKFADTSTAALTSRRLETRGTAYGDNIDAVAAYSKNTIHGFAGADTLTGNSGADWLYGGDHDDTLAGNAGNDILDGGAGENILAGGIGNDVFVLGGSDYASDDGTTDNDLYLVSAAALGDIEILEGGGTADALYITLLSGQTYDFVADGDVLNIVLTSGTDVRTITLTNQLGQSVADSLIDNIVFGTFGGDIYNWTGSYSHSGIKVELDGLKRTINGTSAGETINGGDFDLVADTIDGQSGNDIIYALKGNDTVKGGAGNDHVYGGAGNDTLDGEANDDTLEGGDGDDIIEGGAGADYLWGNGGTDYLYGEDGVDALRGLEGNDTLWGGAGDDNLKGDDVASSSSFTGAGDDELHGGLGTDNLAGGAGNDILYGEQGTDTLYGDAGADVFKWEAGSTADMDYIMDFNVGQGDQIDISLLIDYDSGIHNIADFARFANLTYHTRLQVDRDGAGTAYGWENVVQLQNLTGLDFSTMVDTSIIV